MEKHLVERAKILTREIPKATLQVREHNYMNDWPILAEIVCHSKFSITDLRNCKLHVNSGINNYQETAYKCTICLYCEMPWPLEVQNMFWR